MSNRLGRRIQVVVTLVLISLGFGTQVGWAQSAPTDLADLSLAELLDIDLEDYEKAIEGTRHRLRVGYHYIRSRFDGYRDGTTSLSIDDVQWTPMEPRTLDNFPVVPTVIIQEAHVVDFGLDATDKLSLTVVVPFIRQSTDHVSIVSGYPDFNISSAGIGDVMLSGSYTILRNSSMSLAASGGISMPSGTIDATGDTPRAAGDQQLPYTMQIGSGTWDVPLSVSAVGKIPGGLSMHWGAQALVKIRTGRNERDYKLGNRAMLTGSFSIAPTPWFEPTIKIAAVTWGRITGRDVSLTVPNPMFPYPAGVTDPNKFGGTKVTANLGVVFRIPGADGWWRDQKFDIEGGIPIFQTLNGPQPEEDWRLTIGVRATL